MPVQRSPPMRTVSLVLILTSLIAAQPTEHAPLEGVHHGFVTSGDVKLHYASLGTSGPLVVLLHGFPDFWWTWRGIMPSLAKDHHVVAIDLRGYNLSDKPEGVASYKMVRLIGDVAATIRHFGHKKAIVVGHDWGGAIAWSVAMYRPDIVDKLVILNLPHPRGMRRELANNPDQHKNSQYARDFQKPDAHQKLTAERLASWVKDEKDRTVYVRAFRRGDFRAMTDYYKANFPSPPKPNPTNKPTPKPSVIPTPNVRCPVLMLHGLDDKALLASGLNDTWNWVDKDLTITTVPGAGHFVQQDAPVLVRNTIVAWLHRDGPVEKRTGALGRLINPKCPFSGKPVEPHSLTTYRGKVVGFCNQGCRDKFAREPERYVAMIKELAKQGR